MAVDTRDMTRDETARALKKLLWKAADDRIKQIRDEVDRNVRARFGQLNDELSKKKYAIVVDIDGDIRVPEAEGSVKVVMDIIDDMRLEGRRKEMDIHRILGDAIQNFIITNNRPEGVLIDFQQEISGL
jgi:hypothetical protein